MLRNRLITVLTINNGVLFRTRNFIPDYRYTLNFVDAWSIDEIVIFDNLGKPQIKAIAVLQIDQLRDRLSNLGLSLEMNEGVMDLIVERGYDPAFGARPLKRTIQQLLENPLSQKILAGEYTSGSTINAKVVNNEIAFS